MSSATTIDPFEARGLESLYRERAGWPRNEKLIDQEVRRRVQAAIDRLEYRINGLRREHVWNERAGEWQAGRA